MKIMVINNLKLDVFTSNLSSWTQDRLMKLHMALLALTEGKMRPSSDIFKVKSKSRGEEENWL